MLGAIYGDKAGDRVLVYIAKVFSELTDDDTALEY